MLIKRDSYPRIRTDAPRSFASAAESLAAALLAESPLAWSHFYRYSHRTRRPPDLPAWRAGLLAMLREPARRSAFAGMQLGPKPEGERWAPAVNCPVLVIGGGKDPHFADALGEAETQAILLAGQVAMVDEAGHYPHSEFPSRVAELVLPFWSRRSIRDDRPTPWCRPSRGHRGLSAATPA